MATAMLLLLLFIDTAICGYLYSEVKRLKNAVQTMTEVQKEMARDLGELNADLSARLLRQANESLRNGAGE